jgi:hypothetical protein
MKTRKMLYQDLFKANARIDELEKKLEDSERRANRILEFVYVAEEIYPDFRAKVGEREREKDGV